MWCQVLIRKDKHQVSLVERLFGRKVEEQCRGAGVTKSIVYPELYFAWLARFLKRDQGLLVDPFGIAVNETGTLLISDHNAILTAKLSNPVNVTQLTGGGAAATTVSTSGNLGSCRFENVRGICFIAREVAVVCDVTASTLKVVHVNDQPGWFQLRISETRLSSFQIERPYGIATLRRLDAMAPNPNQRNPNHRAIVAVTEYDRPTILLLSIEQDKSSRTKPYTVTAAVRVGILPVPRSQRLLRGVAGQCIRRTTISVLRARRDAAIEAADDAEDSDAAVAAAHAQFAADSRTSPKVIVTRDGHGGGSDSISRSDVVVIDAAPILESFVTGKPLAGATRQSDGSEKISVEGTTLAHLAVGESAGAVAVDADGVVYAAEQHRIIKCVGASGASSTGAGATAIIEGEHYAGGGDWWPGAQPKDGTASHCTIGDTVALAAWPCGRTLFCLDKGGGVSASLSKIGPLDGLATWFRLWRTQAECLGEKDPTMATDPEYRKKEPPKWDEENLAVLERTATELDAIDQRVCDANGRGHVNGPFMAMDSNSLRSRQTCELLIILSLTSRRSLCLSLSAISRRTRAQTQISVQSMRAVFSRVRAIDPEVAEQLDPSAVREVECERWWATVRHARVVAFPSHPLTRANAHHRLIFATTTTAASAGEITYGRPSVLYGNVLANHPDCHI